MGKRDFCRYLCVMVSIFLLAPQLRPQEQLTERHTTLKNGISKPRTLATHPFGILFYTLPHNFKEGADKRVSIDVSLGSGNIWGQPVTTYIPSDIEDREGLSDLEFFDRINHFDPSEEPSEVYAFQYDGIVKDIRIMSSIPLGGEFDLSIAARSFILTDGKFPLTLLTGDRFIEFFHSNAAGGEDPFGRKLRGFDQAGIEYLDRRGERLHISNGEFIFSGIETALYYYPKLFLESGIYWNFGMHLGTNLSKYNRSLDLGVTLEGLKPFYLTNRKQILFGLGIGLLRKKIVEFTQNQTDLGTNNLLGSFEGHIEYTLNNRKNGHHSFGINYRIQSPYNNKKEEDYYVPFSGDRIKRWHEASRHLYKFPSYWTIMYSFTKRIEFSIYLQQDMVVNNTPDFQTGIRFRLPISDYMRNQKLSRMVKETPSNDKSTHVEDTN